MATIKNFPNNADEYIGAEPVMAWLHGRTSGVFGADQNLAVSANDNMTVSVSDGYGWLANANADGCVFWNDNADTYGSKLTLSVGLANSSLPRIDRVVVSWATVDYSAKPSIEILQGSPASNPQPPALTNTTLKRQISLAQVRVGAGASKITASDITDERLDNSVCGLVTESVGVDTSVMQAQFNELLSLIQAQLEGLNAGTESMTKTMYDRDRRGRDIFRDIPYLYKATFDASGWYGSGTLTQTATLTAVDGGGVVMSTSILLPDIGIASDIDADAKAEMQSAAGAVAKAKKTLGYNSITVELDSAPDVDLELYFLIRRGDSTNVPAPLDPVGAGDGIKELWRNAVPGSTFLAQTIPVPGLAKVDQVQVIFEISKSDAIILPAVSIPKGFSNGRCFFYNTGGGTERNFQVNFEAETIHFDSATGGNDYRIPVQVLGVKF